MQNKLQRQLRGFYKLKGLRTQTQVAEAVKQWKVLKLKKTSEAVTEAINRASWFQLKITLFFCSLNTLYIFLRGRDRRT
ncbi:unnamed protein product [Trifolium pratense]|uniref:Uncharacterized protein n=2 Tax=Trifolium pratense TaxID=57577 RepID=A0ACB0LP72_TRIPR|nr:unnamed protein product [Trifolium pratense]CAJ2670158.1 unnamed protein product [Trifolium pratense]